MHRLSPGPFVAGFGLALALACAGYPTAPRELASAGAPARADALQLRVMTYNVLVDLPRPGYDPWSMRGRHVIEQIDHHEPDLIGLQEPFGHQVRSFERAKTRYRSIGTPWDPDATLLFREDRFDLIASGHFWHTQGPLAVFTGMGNVLPRLVVWAVLQDRHSGRRLFFANTHFDATPPFQRRAAPLYRDALATLAQGLPVVATGDFNSQPRSRAYKSLTDPCGPLPLVDTYPVAERREVRLDPQDARDPHPERRIDHVFVANGDWRVERWLQDMTRYGTHTLRDASDHFAVVVDLELVPTGAAPPPAAATETAPRCAGAD